VQFAVSKGRSFKELKAISKKRQQGSDQEMTEEEGKDVGRYSSTCEEALSI